MLALLSLGIQNVVVILGVVGVQSRVDGVQTGIGDGAGDQALVNVGVGLY